MLVKLSKGIISGSTEELFHAKDFPLVSWSLEGFKRNLQRWMLVKRAVNEC